MEFNIITPDTEEKEINDEEIQLNENNNNKMNIIKEPEKKEDNSNTKYKEYILYQEKESNNQYILNLYYDKVYYYFKIKKKETIDISLYFFFNKLNYSSLLKKLNLNHDKFTDFKTIENYLIELLDKKEVYLKKEENDSIKIVFKSMDTEKELTLKKTEMNEDEKFEKIVNEINALKDVNEGKIEELKKMSKEIEEDADKKCKEQKETLDILEKQIDQNKADIDEETNEIELLKEEMQKIKDEIKENQDNLKHKKDCIIY